MQLSINISHSIHCNLSNDYQRKQILLKMVRKNEYPNEANFSPITGNALAN